MQNKKRLLKLAHPAMILGSSKASGGKDLYYAPMTKGAAHHNDFVPEKSLDYLSGPKVDEKSKLHVGKPFKASRDEFEQKSPPDFTQTPEQEAKYYHDAQKNEKNPKPSAHSSSEADLDPDAAHHLPSADSHRAVVAADQDHPCLLVPLTDTHDLDADAVEVTAKVHRVDDLDAVAAEDNRPNCWLPTLASDEFMDVE